MAIDDRESYLSSSNIAQLIVVPAKRIERHMLSYLVLHLSHVKELFRNLVLQSSPKQVSISANTAKDAKMKTFDKLIMIVLFTTFIVNCIRLAASRLRIEACINLSIFTTISILRPVS